MPTTPRKTMPPKDCPPWSTNNAGQIHYMERNRRAQAWKKATIEACAEANVPDLPLDPSFVQCVIPFWTRTRRDPMNYVGTCCKAIVDGLVEAGFWPDDTAEFVCCLPPICEVMPKADRYVTIRVTPMAEGIHL